MQAKPKWWVDYIAAIRQFQAHMATCGCHLEKTTEALNEFKRAYKRAEGSSRR